MASDQRISTEFSCKVFDDDHGYYVEVGNDLDSLGLVQIAYHEPGGEDRQPIVLPKKHALALAAAITRIVELNPDP